MNDGIIVAGPVDRYGRIRPVKDTAFIGQPILGYVVRMEDGFYAIADRDVCERRDSIDEAAAFITQKWRVRK